MSTTGEWERGEEEMEKAGLPANADREGPLFPVPLAKIGHVALGELAYVHRERRLLANEALAGAQRFVVPSWPSQLCSAKSQLTRVLEDLVRVPMLFGAMRVRVRSGGSGGGEGGLRAGKGGCRDELGGGSHRLMRFGVLENRNRG